MLGAWADSQLEFSIIPVLGEPSHAVCQLLELSTLITEGVKEEEKECIDKI